MIVCIVIFFLVRYCLKLLCAMAEANPMFVAVFARLQLTPKFVAFFQPEHSHLNVHTIRLVAMACQAPDADLPSLYRLGMCDRLD